MSVGRLRSRCKGCSRSETQEDLGDATVRHIRNLSRLRTAWSAVHLRLTSRDPGVALVEAYAKVQDCAPRDWAAKGPVPLTSPASLGLGAGVRRLDGPTNDDDRTRGV